MDILFVDFETYYNRKEKFDLRSISMTEYIRHPKFKVLGMGYSDKYSSGWVPGNKVKEALENYEGDWSKTAICAHNVKFDGAILSWIYGVKPLMYLDTQSLARAVLGSSIDGYSLKRLAEYLGLEPKGDLLTDGLDTLSAEQESQLAEYCLTDVRICQAIWNKLQSQFPPSQLFSLDWTARAFIEPTLVLNTELLDEAVKDEKARRDLAISLTGATKEELASNKRFADLVARRGYAVPTKTSSRTGREIPAFSKSDEGFKNIERLDPVLYAGRLAAKSTILETRGMKLYEISKTGPWPFDVQFSGAIQTHRYSGGNGAGGNPQNFPRIGPLRSSVSAPAGYSLVVGDFAQIEARLVAWLAGEPKLMAAFSEERDVYSEFASRVYKRPITKADDQERRFGKECILGLGYNMGWEKFQARVKQVMGLEISDEKAKEVVSLYRTTYFNIPRLWERAQGLLPLMRDGRTNLVPFAPYVKIGREALILPSGLRILYPNLRIVSKKFIGGDWRYQWGYDHYIKRYTSEVATIYGGKIIENLCQALAGEITKIAIERCEKSGVTVKGQVHDELLCVCEHKREQSTCELVSKAMEAPIPWLPTLKLKAEVGYGANWAEAKV
jgi:DNA polymerase bacteriophage-type